MAWRLLQNTLPLSVDLQWGLACLCLSLQQPCVWNRLSTPEYATYTCSLVHCLRLIIAAGKRAVGWRGGGVDRACVCQQLLSHFY